MKRRTVDRATWRAGLASALALACLANGCLGILDVNNITAAPDGAVDANTSKMDSSPKEGGLEDNAADADNATLLVGCYSDDGGSGVVTVTPPGADAGGTLLVVPSLGGCGGGNVFTYGSGTRVTVAAMPDKGSQFDGWNLMYENFMQGPSECDSGTGATCVVTVVAGTLPTVLGNFIGSSK